MSYFRLQFAPSGVPKAFIFNLSRSKHIKRIARRYKEATQTKRRYVIRNALT